MRRIGMHAYVATPPPGGDSRNAVARSPEPGAATAERGGEGRILPGRWSR